MPRHPCDIKPSAIADIGLRLTEGIHELKIGENLAPTRDAITSALSTGSSNLFKAFDGVRSEVSSRLAAPRPSSSASTASIDALPTPSAPSPPPVNGRGPFERRGSAPSLGPPQNAGGLRPLSLANGGLGLTRLRPVPARAETIPPVPAVPTPSLADTAQAARATLSTWGASLWGSRGKAAAPPSIQPTPSHGADTFSSEPIGSPSFQIRDLDKEREERDKAEAERRAAAGG